MNNLDTSYYSIHREDVDRTITNVKDLANGKLPVLYPYQLQVNLTDRCNLFYNNGPKDCVGCSFPVKNDIAVPIDGLIKKITQFSHCQGSSILITGGGEPGMYAHWNMFLRGIAQLNLSLDVNTNGLVSAVYSKLIRNSDDGARLLQKIYSFEKKTSTMSFSVHDEGAYKAIEVLSKIKRELNLNIRLRSTLLIHEDTTLNEINKFLERSKKSGSDVIHFKPFHVYDAKSGVRRFVKNLAVFEFLHILCAKPQNDIQIGALRLDRLHPDYVAIEQETIFKRFSNQADELALDPLFTIFLDTNLRPAYNCDTKAIGIGDVGEILISQNFATPAQYFFNALHSIVTTNTKNLLIGDNFTEMNALLQSNSEFSELIVFLKNLRTQFFSAKLSSREVEGVLSNHFV